MNAEPPAALGVLPDLGPADFTFEDDSGRGFKLRIQPAAGDGDSREPAKDPVPLPFQHPEDPFWFTYLVGSETVYVDFRSYHDLESQAARLWEFIANNSVKRLVIDMRWNGGGNYTKGREHLIYKLVFIRTLDRTGHLFVITGRKTFSAGMTNVTDLRRETEVILVGEPTQERARTDTRKTSGSLFRTQNYELPALCSNTDFSRQQKPKLFFLTNGSILTGDRLAQVKMPRCVGFWRSHSRCNPPCLG